MKQPKGLAGLFPHSGAVQMNCTDWWIVQMILDWNWDNFTLPTFKMITEKLEKQQREQRPAIYFGFERDAESVIEEFTRNGFIGALQDKNEDNRYYVTPKGKKALETQWIDVGEDTLEFKHFFKSDKSLIPKAKSFRRTG